MYENYELINILGDNFNYNDRMYIKKSLIPNSGNGIFTKVFLKKGTKIRINNNFEFLNDHEIFNIEPIFENTGLIFTNLILYNKDKYVKEYKKYVNKSKLKENIECKYIVNHNNKKIFIYIEVKRDIQANEELYRSYKLDWLMFIFDKLSSYSKRIKYLKLIYELTETFYERYNIYLQLKDSNYINELKEYLSFR